MKRVAIAVAVLLLAGCSSPSEKIAGQVISCESISSSTTENSVVLDCLDGRTFVENNGITWPNLFDADGKSRAYFGMGVPVTWFIAADGSVAHKYIGVFKSEKELISLTSKHLGVEI